MDISEDGLIGMRTLQETLGTDTGQQHGDWRLSQALTVSVRGGVREALEWRRHLYRQ